MLCTDVQSIDRPAPEYADAIIEFNQVIPIGTNINYIIHNHRVYYDVCIIKMIDDCTYRCSTTGVEDKL